MIGLGQADGLVVLQDLGRRDGHEKQHQHQQHIDHGRDLEFRVAIGVDAPALALAFDRGGGHLGKIRGYVPQSSTVPQFGQGDVPTVIGALQEGQLVVTLRETFCDVPARAERDFAEPSAAKSGPMRTPAS